MKTTDNTQSDISLRFIDSSVFGGMATTLLRKPLECQLIPHLLTRLHYSNSHVRVLFGSKKISRPALGNAAG
jgi:hypothetical protein